MKFICLWVAGLTGIALCNQPEGYAAEPKAEPLSIEEIECRGNAITECEFIRRKLHLMINSPVVDDEINTARLRLSALSNFRSVDIRLEKGSEKGKARLIVEVVEASPIVTEVTAGIQHFSARAPIGLDPANAVAEYLAGRISDQNLFDRQKILELSAGGSHIASRESGGKGISATVVYIDPALLGVERLFLSGFVSYGETRSYSASETALFDPISGAIVNFKLRSDSTNQATSLGMSIGYRLWDYSYVFARVDRGTTHADFHAEVEPPTPPLSINSRSSSRSNALRVGYGWDGEDDAYFPTQGSVFSAIAFKSSSTSSLAVNCVNCRKYNWSAAYKKTWAMWGRSIWTVNVGGEPAAIIDRLRPIQNNSASGLGLRYAYPFSSPNTLDGARRGRWYVQLGADPVQIRGGGRIGGHPDHAAITLGLRFENKLLGVVDLYATGSRQWPRPIAF